MMVDVYDKVMCSKNMWVIVMCDMVIEKWIVVLLIGVGFIFVVQDCVLLGCFDFILFDYCCVIFIYGCFWYYYDCYLFKVLVICMVFWLDKIVGNVVCDVCDW